VHHVGILYGQFMMHGQRNIKLKGQVFLLVIPLTSISYTVTFTHFV